MIHLMPHQKFCVKFMRNHRGLIVFHSTGSGKTYTALFAMAQFREPVIIVGTKASRKTFQDSISKAQLDGQLFTYYTYQKVKPLVENDVLFFNHQLVIVDEAHNMRNETTANLYLNSSLRLCRKIMLLTATPIINYPNDLSVLVNTVRAEDVLPTERSLFDEIYYDPETRGAINQTTYLEKIQCTISYYHIQNNEHYPEVQQHWHRVVMDHQQIDEYIRYLRKIIYQKQEIDEAAVLNINYALLPSRRKNVFLTVTRQLSNTAQETRREVTSPKIKAMMEIIQSAPKPIIVYSNFLKNGIYLLIRHLEAEKISYAVITGETTNDRLNVVVDSYNRGKYVVLCISSAGSETLDFRNTRQIHIMEPHWNDARIQQVTGRAIRYDSHADLPPEQRKVDVYHWISVFPDTIRNMSADEYLVEMSREKSAMMQLYLRTIQRASIEVADCP